MRGVCTGGRPCHLFLNLRVSESIGVRSQTAADFPLQSPSHADEGGAHRTPRVYQCGLSGDGRDLRCHGHSGRGLRPPLGDSTHDWLARVAISSGAVDS